MSNPTGGAGESSASLDSWTILKHIITAVPIATHASTSLVVSVFQYGLSVDRAGGRY